MDNPDTKNDTKRSFKGGNDDGGPAKFRRFSEGSDNFRGGRGGGNFRGSRGGGNFRGGRDGGNFRGGRGGGNFRGGRGGGNFNRGNRSFDGGSRGNRSFDGGNRGNRSFDGGNRSFNDDTRGGGRGRGRGRGFFNNNRGQNGSRYFNRESNENDEGKSSFFQNRKPYNQNGMFDKSDTPTKHKHFDNNDNTDSENEIDDTHIDNVIEQIDKKLGGKNDNKKDDTEMDITKAIGNTDTNNKLKGHGKITFDDDEDEENSEEDEENSEEDDEDEENSGEDESDEQEQLQNELGTLDSTVKNKTDDNSESDESSDDSPAEAKIIRKQPEPEKLSKPQIKKSISTGNKSIPDKSQRNEKTKPNFTDPVVRNAFLPNTIFLKNLPNALNTWNLRKFFSKYGTIVNCFKCVKFKSGSITFDKRDAALAALEANGLYCFNYYIHVYMQDDKKSDASKRIQLKDITSGINFTALWGACLSKYGPISKISTNEGHPITDAIVEFENTESAEAALADKKLSIKDTQIKIIRVGIQD